MSLEFGCPPKFIHLYWVCHDGMRGSVSVEGRIPEPFPVVHGVKQGCGLLTEDCSYVISNIPTYERNSCKSRVTAECTFSSLLQKNSSNCHTSETMTQRPWSWCRHCVNFSSLVIAPVLATSGSTCTHCTFGCRPTSYNRSLFYSCKEVQFTHHSEKKRRYFVSAPKVNHISCCTWPLTLEWLLMTCKLTLCKYFVRYM